MSGATRFLQATHGVEEVSGDILRVLYMFFGRLWFSEIVDEVNAFRSTLGLGTVEPRVVREALKLLEREGAVKIEESVRASLARGAVPDLLVSLVPDHELVPMLASDERIRRYREFVSELFKKSSKP